LSRDGLYYPLGNASASYKEGRYGVNLVPDEKQNKMLRAPGELFARPEGVGQLAARSGHSILDISGAGGVDLLTHGGAARRGGGPVEKLKKAHQESRTKDIEQVIERGGKNTMPCHTAARERKLDQTTLNQGLSVKRAKGEKGEI